MFKNTVRLNGLKKTLVFSFLYASASALQAQSVQQGFTQPSHQAISTVKTSEVYELKLQPSKQLYISTDPIAVTATLKNLSLSTVPIGVTDPSTFVTFRVLRDGNHAVPLSQWGRFITDATGTQSGLHRTGRLFLDSLGPGQSISLIFDLNRMYDMTMSGDYKVVASITVSGNDAKGAPTIVTSIPIVIKMAGDDVSSVFGKPDIEPNIPGKKNDWLRYFEAPVAIGHPASSATPPSKQQPLN